MSGAIFDAVPQAPQPSVQPASKSSRFLRISNYFGISSILRGGPPTTSTLPEVAKQRSESMRAPEDSHNSEAAQDRSTALRRTRSNVESGYNNFREGDRIGRKPEIVQMMETLSCDIMVNGISEPIPRHLNALIISMVEEFRIHLGKLKTLQADFDELQTSRHNEAQDFMDIAHAWHLRELSFKARIKRLERIILNTHDGADSVILARAGSIVDRHDGREVQAKLDRLSKSKSRCSL